MSRSHGRRRTGNKLASFIPRVRFQEPSERRRASAGDGGRILPTKQEFAHAASYGEGVGVRKGEDGHAGRSLEDGEALAVTGIQNIEIGDRERDRGRGEYSDEKDSIRKNEEEEDGVKRGVMESTAEIQESAETCDVKEGNGGTLVQEHRAGDPTGIDGEAVRSSVEGGEATSGESGRDGEKGQEKSESMPSDNEEGKSEVETGKQPSAAITHEIDDEGDTSGGPRGEEEPVGAEIEVEAEAPGPGPVPVAEQQVQVLEGEAVAAAINDQTGNEGNPAEEDDEEEEFPDFKTAKSLKFGYLIRRLRR